MNLKVHMFLDLIQVILPIIESDQLALDFKQSSLDDYIKVC